MTQERCGFVALIGRPNVGKSTLLNHLLGKKISITSRKPQTTRHRVLGIKTIENLQFIFVDTPGLHRQGKHALNRCMNRTVHQVLQDVDVIVFIVDARGWREADSWVLTQLRETTTPVILVINKIDRLSDKTVLLEYLQNIQAKYSFIASIPLSAKTGAQIERLEQCITENLPTSPHLFAKEQLTDRSEQFIITERIREKLMRALGEELPYALTVTIDVLEEQAQIIRIAAIIWVEKSSQKAIVIGEGGIRLKHIGQQARLDLEQFFGKKIFLQLWVKVKEGWSDSEQSLRRFGYEV